MNKATIVRKAVKRVKDAGLLCESTSDSTDWWNDPERVKVRLIENIRLGK